MLQTGSSGRAAARIRPRVYWAREARAGVAERQTRQTQNLLSVRTWEFKSPRPHQWCQALKATETGSPGLTAGYRRPGPIRASLGQFCHPREKAAEKVSPPPPLSAGSRSPLAPPAQAIA